MHVDSLRINTLSYKHINIPAYWSENEKSEKRGYTLNKAITKFKQSLISVFYILQHNYM